MFYENLLKFQQFRSS